MFDQTVERRWHPNPDAFLHKDYVDSKARRQEEMERRTEAKRRKQEERQAELAQRFRLAAVSLQAAREVARAQSEHREASTEPIDSGLGDRVSLVPRLLKEILTHPFSDFTLVKRNGRVFVVRRGSDLKSADLSGANLRRADLRGVNFQDALLAQANLEEANLTGANLKGADLREANLRKADLRGAVLDDCDFRGADLRGSKVDDFAVLWRAKREGALLSEGSLHEQP